MYIGVKLLNGFQESLVYHVPNEFCKNDLIGVIVRVPLRNRIESAVVQTTYSTQPIVSFKIKSIYGIEQMPHDPDYYPFLSQLAMYYQVDVVQFIRRIAQFIRQKEKVSAPVLSTPGGEDESPIVTLTDEQQMVCDVVRPAISNGSFMPTLLHGVTGSGKTEVYKNLIQHALAENKTALLLLPEVTLAVQFLDILKRQLPGITLFGFHSATGTKEKRYLWRQLCDHKAAVIVGVHLPVMLPIANLGLIVIDEEHDTGYQEKKHPRIHTKEAALWRAQFCKIPIVLGSATPSISSLYNVKKKGWHFFQMHKRFAGEFPTVQWVRLSKENPRNNFWISRELEHELRQQLDKREQSILFINRRGFSFFVQCKQCSFIVVCSSCSVSLTLHQDDRLMCHYCGYAASLPDCCPSCKASSSNFLKKGIGTQQVMSILQKLFPTAVVERADLDATVNKKKWQATLASFAKGTIDILVGTQTITKGYHFPNVTLVGVLWADLHLHFPVFNATETTLQQLIQVAGRAGRGAKKSKVIVQSMIDHPLFLNLNEVDYLKFYQEELAHRLEIGYPPAVRFVEIELKSTDEQRLEYESHMLAQTLQEAVSGERYEITVLGPTVPPVAKIKQIYARRIYLKGTSIAQMIELYGRIEKTHYQSSLFFTPNPVS